MWMCNIKKYEKCVYKQFFPFEVCLVTILECKIGDFWKIGFTGNFIFVHALTIV